ncbi:MAG TPA: hypothetical protein VIU11_27430 [Nakamurella sp.]
MTQWTAAGAFSKDAGTDYEARCVLGKAAYGIGDVGLVLSTLDRIGDEGPQAWFDQWSATAQGLAERAVAAAASGHRTTASWAYLAAAQYFATGLGALDGLADQSVLTPTFASPVAVLGWLHRRLRRRLRAGRGAPVRLAAHYAVARVAHPGEDRPALPGRGGRRRAALSLGWPWLR